MKPDYDNSWEAELDRELKDLPDLTAPKDLIPRTMNILARPAAPWHSRPWYSWPIGPRVASLAVGVVALAGAIPGWRAIQPGLIAPLAARTANFRAGVECLWNAVVALAGAAAALVDHYGKGMLLWGAVAVALAYVACIGFGTAFVRLAFAGPRKTQI